MNATVLEKIRKLRALSQSDNVNEAAAAAAAAERLIQEHNIAEAELEAAGEEQAEAPTKEDLAEIGSSSPTWKAFLSSAIERAHGCAGYQSRRNGRIFYVVCGRPSDIATVRYLFAWLSAEIERLCTEDATLSGRTARNSFRLGAVEGIRDAMYEARKTARAAASSAALVVVDQRLEQARAVLPEDLRSGRSASPSIDRNARERGRRAGKSLHVGQRLDTGAGARLLGGGGRR